MVAVFAIYNYAEVLIKFPWGSYSISQALIILGSATLGAVAVLLFGIFSSIKTRIKIWELNNRIKKLEKELKTYKDKEQSIEPDYPDSTKNDFKVNVVDEKAIADEDTHSVEFD